MEPKKRINVTEQDAAAAAEAVEDLTVDQMLDRLRKAMVRTVTYIDGLNKVLTAEEVDLVGKAARTLSTIQNNTTPPDEDPSTLTEDEVRARLGKKK